MNVKSVGYGWLSIYISNGSSGGALFNDNGEVIGVTYASLESGQNLNFAVPIEFVKSLWKLESLDRSELNSFYDTITPHYSIEYVISNYKELENSVFYLDCVVSSFDDSTGMIIANCIDNCSKTMKAISHTNDYFTERLMELTVKNGNSIKCIGTGWSEYDNEPYVIMR